MVRYSKLAFRELVKRHGVGLAYTPMIMADSFLASEAARHQELPVRYNSHTATFQATDIVQFAAREPAVFTEAAKLVAPFCSGVDLNCGCPQRWAMQEGVGSALQREPELVYEMARQCSDAIPVPVSVKIRLDKEDVRRTVDVCRLLSGRAGVKVITVHGGPLPSATLTWSTMAPLRW
jgi:tRNA-dihydrouridine synthase 4